MIVGTKKSNEVVRNENQRTWYYRKGGNNNIEDEENDKLIRQDQNLLDGNMSWQPRHRPEYIWTNVSESTYSTLFQM